ncbi:MAG: histidine kinase, partial [Bacillota bacterium]|nr:histidine kinase [Bacillota bacterium]
MDLRSFNIALEGWGFIFCLTTAFIIFISSKKRGKKENLLIAMMLVGMLLLFSDGIASVFRGDIRTTGCIIVVVANFMAYLSSYALLWLFTSYLINRIDAEGSRLIRFWMITIHILCAIAVVFLIISQFNHMYYYFDDAHLYTRGSWFWLSQVFGIIGTLGNMVLLLIHRNKIERGERIALFSYILLPSVAMIIQLFFYGIALLNLSIAIALLWMYVALHMENTRLQIHQAEMLARQQQQMNEIQIKVVLSQIQPHFLYNTLNSIYYLCGKEPETAQKAVSQFSEYLRGNLDSLKINEPIPFEVEMRHIKNYLSLEKMRFGEKLNIVYDISATNFMLPALSLQPIVENAVKHGVGKRRDGGTVTIRTLEKEDAFVVLVIDDGVGFNAAEKKNDERTHIGIENVRQRLWSMSKGKLIIDTKHGCGTRAALVIPKA